MSSRAGQATYRDRTQEFVKAVKSLTKTTPPAPEVPSVSDALRLDSSNSAASNQSEFNKRSSRIGLGIHQTSQKLTKLAKCE